jgi:hypothetical protein
MLILEINLQTHATQIKFKEIQFKEFQVTSSREIHINIESQRKEIQVEEVQTAIRR